MREHLRSLEAAGAKAVAVRRPGELEAVDALVIPGGESTTMWKLAETFDLIEPLRLRIKNGMPAYGSCAGMIMLADRIESGVDGQQTIGGIDMVVRRNAFGRQIASFEADIDFAGRGSCVRCSSVRRGWNPSGPRWKCWLGPKLRIGSSRSVRDRCSPRPSIRNLPGMSACIHTSLRW